MSTGNPLGVPFDSNLCHSLTISLIPIPRAALFKSHDTQAPCPQRRRSRTEGETLEQHLRPRSFHRSSSGPLKPSQDSGGSRAADWHFFTGSSACYILGQKQVASDLLPGFIALCQDSLNMGFRLHFPAVAVLGNSFD